jgi:hypothetical protein
MFSLKCCTAPVASAQLMGYELSEYADAVWVGDRIELQNHYKTKDPQA